MRRLAKGPAVQPKAVSSLVLIRKINPGTLANHLVWGRVLPVYACCAIKLIREIDLTVGASDVLNGPCQAVSGVSELMS